MTGNFSLTLVSLATYGRPHIGLFIPKLFGDGLDSSDTVHFLQLTMFWIFLLHVINGFECSPEPKHETLCTPGACFTINMHELKFEEAHQKCVHNGGSLVTVAKKEDEDVLRSLLSKIHKTPQDTTVHFWIGLKLKAGSCVLQDKALRGFQWVSGEEGSQYSNWKTEPDRTCLSERCVKVSYSLSGDNQLEWTAGSCRSHNFYACRFTFRGMCRPLVLKGPGSMTYTLPISEKSETSRLELVPMGTYAIITCRDNQGHYSVCEKTSKWSAPGPFCTAVMQDCTVNNGGCEHQCHQDGPQVRCLCKEGYDLQEDGFSCRFKDLCHVDTCEHLCVMTDSGFFCKCPHGFRLHENQRNCSDIDECQTQVCEDHACENTHGSYRCACRDGYELADGECRDIDECARSRCQHGCSNSVGSFTCACPQGFRLEPDGLRCALSRTVPSESDGPPAVIEDSTESLTRTTVELQHQSPHTDAPLPELVNVTHGDQRSIASPTASSANALRSKLMLCVLGSVVPLLLLISVTLAVVIFRCSRSKKIEKEKTTADGYCWVSSGLDRRLEFYESILTDDL